MSVLSVNLSLAAYPGLHHVHAIQTALQAYDDDQLLDPLFGPLSLAHIQVVPQNIGIVDEELAQAMRDTLPEARFRLHANVRVMARRSVYDLSNAREHAAHFEQAAKIQQILGGAVYSAHAGYRAQADMHTMMDNARWLADLFGQPVAIEGLYPDRSDSQLLSNWQEYKALLDSRLPYALDLSHLNIVAHKLRRREDALVSDLLASEQCLEIHVSDNDGRGDHHQGCDAANPPWWMPFLAQRNPNAIVFSEGNLRRRRDHNSGDLP